MSTKLCSGDNIGTIENKGTYILFLERKDDSSVENEPATKNAVPTEKEYSGEKVYMGTRSYKNLISRIIFATLLIHQLPIFILKTIKKHYAPTFGRWSPKRIYQDI